MLLGHEKLYRTSECESATVVTSSGEAIARVVNPARRNAKQSCNLHKEEHVASLETTQSQAFNGRFKSSRLQVRSSFGKHATLWERWPSADTAPEKAVGRSLGEAERTYFKRIY